MIISLSLIALMVGTISAAVLWQSEPMQRTITISWGSAITIDTMDVQNYITQTAPSTIQETADARSDTFAIALLENVVTEDLVLTVDIQGAPEGATIETRMSWICYQKRIEDPTTTKITAFNSAGVAQLIKANGDYAATIDTSTFTVIPETGLVIPNNKLPRMTYETLKTLNVPTVEDSNAIWIYVLISTDDVIGYGEWNLQITASLSEV